MKLVTQKHRRKLCNHITTYLRLNAPVFKLEQCTHKSSDYGSNVIERANYPNIIQIESLSGNGTCYGHAVFVFVETNIKTRDIEVKKEKLTAANENWLSLFIHRDKILCNWMKRAAECDIYSNTKYLQQPHLKD
jgi:hypothetical protein